MKCLGYVDCNQLRVYIGENVLSTLGLLYPRLPAAYSQSSLSIRTSGDRLELPG